MMRCLSYLNSMSDIVYKKNTKFLVDTINNSFLIHVRRGIL